jgi:MFS family permease
LKARPFADRASAGVTALQFHAFRVYFVGAFARGAAVWMQIAAIPWAAIEIGAGPAAVGMVVGLQYIPALVISPFGGVIADRARRVLLLIGTQSALVAVAVVLAIVVRSGSASIAALGTLALALGIVTAIDLPVRQTFMADLVPAESVASAASLHSSAWNTTRFVGPALAGVVITIIGVAAAFIVSAMMLGLVVASFVGLARNLPHERPLFREATGVFSSIREAIGAASSRPEVRLAFLLAALGHLFGAQVFQTVAPMFVSIELGQGASEYGLLVAAWGFGAVVSSYVSTLLARDRRLWMLTGVTGVAACMGLLALIGSIGPAVICAGGLGFMQIALAQNAVVTVQAASLGEIRGRVVGVYASLLHGMSPIGAILAGLLGELIGIRGAMMAASLLLFIAIAVVVAMQRGPHAASR